MAVIAIHRCYSPGGGIFLRLGIGFHRTVDHALDIHGDIIARGRREFRRSVGFRVKGIDHLIVLPDSPFKHSLVLGVDGLYLAGNGCIT